MTLSVAEVGALRQAFLIGRVAESVTGRPLVVKDAALDLVRGDSSRRLAMTFGQRAAGWYVVTLLNIADLPVPAVDQVWELRLTVTLGDGRSGNASVSVVGEQLARVPRTVKVSGSPAHVLVVQEAPFSLDLAIAPRSLRIAGVVIADHDPLAPVEGAHVTVGGLSDTTDAAGGFHLGPLDAVAEVEITVSLGVVTTVFPYRPDFTVPINLTELSIPV